MIHARKDYDRIQDPAGLIGEDEPVFLLRSTDSNAPDTLYFWANLSASSGAKPDIVKLARKQAERMCDWQRQFGHKVADLPIERKPFPACDAKTGPAVYLVHDAKQHQHIKSGDRVSVVLDFASGSWILRRPEMMLFSLQDNYGAYVELVEEDDCDNR